MNYLTRSILRLPPRKKNAKKGDYGRVLVIAGSRDYVGAAALATAAALAILRSGTDLVAVAAPAKVAWAINCLVPDIITVKVKGDYFEKRHVASLLRRAQKYDVILLGCGISMKSASFVKAFVRRMNNMSKPMVIDADALKAIRLQDVKNAILTPHRGEYYTLMKNSRLPTAMTQDAFKKVRRHLGSNVVLLKGPVDAIMGRERIAFNKTGNPVLAKAGTGDVLAGLCAGFLAQTKPVQTKDPPTKGLFKAACMAAYLNGAIGDHLLKRRGRTFIASDIVENIYKVFR